MKYKKILLINPPTKTELGNLRPPTSLGYIAETLKVNRIDYRVLDMMLGYNTRDLLKVIKVLKPDLVGVTMVTLGYKTTYDLIRQIKDDNPNLPIVVGGPHISTFREKALEECREIDYGVVLEGEKTIVELCRGTKNDKIKGLIFRKKGEVIYVGDREFISDLNNIPFPKYGRFEISRYTNEKPIISSRGCPYTCVYCPVAAAIGRKFRVRSAKNVVDELEYWYKKGYKQFNFLDDNFTLHKDRVYQICDEIEKRKLKILISCTNGVRADRVDKELLLRMYSVGFRRLAFGVEAGNDKVLTAVNKGEKIEVIERAIKEACEIGYDVALFFLYGSPTETWKDIKDSIKIALKFPIFKVNFYNIIPYPQTELYSWLEKNNYFVKNHEEYLNSGSSYTNDPVFITPELSLGQRKRIFTRLKKVEKIVMMRAIKRKLSKYKFIPDFMNSFLALIFVQNFCQRLLFNNVHFRKMVEQAKYYHNLR